MKRSFVREAIQSQNPDVLLSGLQHYTDLVLSIVNQMPDADDVPLVLIALRNTQRGLEQTLSEDGASFVQEIDDAIKANIVTFVVQQEK